MDVKSLSFSPDTKPAKLFYAALRRLLRPLVKASVGHGIIFPAMVALLRELYVDVAREDFVVEGKEQTLSRINLITGITRREVRRLLCREPEADEAPQSLSLSARIVSVWLGNQDYRDSKGRPVSLPLTAPEGDPSLERLVASVSKDVRARAVLDEWLRLGIVKMSGYIVHLEETAFIPKQGYEEKIYDFGRNLRDHIASGVHNLENGSSPLFDRAVYYDQLSSESLEELRRLVNKEGASLILKINRKARILTDKDEAVGGELSGRMTLGIYHFSEEEKL